MLENKTNKRITVDVQRQSQNDLHGQIEVFQKYMNKKSRAMLLIFLGYNWGTNNIC